MIKLSINFESMILKHPVKVDIALPYPCLNDKPIKSLVTLHCAFKDGSFFFDSLGIGNFVDKYKIAVISPSNSGTDAYLSQSQDYMSFLNDEFYPWVINNFNLSKNREDHGLFGISMGAYGALLWSLDEQNLFSQVALVSGVYDFNNYDLSSLKKQRNHFMIYKLIIPSAIESQKNVKNHGSLIKRLLAEETVAVSKIDYHIFYGTEDGLSDLQSKSLYQAFKSKNFTCSIYSSTGGHDADFWKLALNKFIESFAN